MFVCQLILRAADLERDQETFFGCPHQSTKVTFKASDIGDHMKKAKSNFLGNVEGNFSPTKLILMFFSLVKEFMLPFNIIFPLQSCTRGLHLDWFHLSCACSLSWWQTAETTE